MEYRVITTEHFNRFVTNLISTYDVYGPTHKYTEFVYDRIRRPEDLALEFIRTVLPAKKFMLPPEETLFRYKTDGSEFSMPENEISHQILIGPHPCDINGIRLLDGTFERDYRDTYYLKKRNQTTIIGTYCHPDGSCFCESVGHDKPVSGFDLFLIDFDGYYLVMVGTEEGKRLLEKFAETREATGEEIAKREEYEKVRASKFTSRINTHYSNLPLLYSGAFESKVWKDQGEICLSCGTCVMVCPTCYCFDIQDEVSSNLVEGMRVRKWDACQLENFARVASGENFRDSAGARVRHRMYRKFKYLNQYVNAPFCVGCGRCGKQCLVHINPVDVCNDLLTRY